MPINKSYVLTEQVVQVTIRRGSPTEISVAFDDATAKERSVRRIFCFQGGRVEDDKGAILDPSVPSALASAITAARNQATTYVQALVAADKLADE